MKKILFPIILIFTYSLSGQTQLITNGGFTQSSGWITTGDFVYNTNNTQYNLDPGYAYTSNVNNSFGNLQQGITIPVNATSVTLTLYHKISTSETTSTTAFDICDIEILSSSSSSSTLLTTLSNLDASSSYVSLSLSIPSTYFGQTVSLLFTADNDGGNPTRFRIDNVSVLATLSTGGTVDITTWNNTVDSTSIFPGNITNVACDHGYQTGSLSSSTSLAVGYYLSSDQHLDAGDVFLDDDQTSLSSSDSYDPENEDVLIPASTPSGNYNILFVADKDDDVSESNETNNVVAVPITVKSTAAPLGSLTVTISPSGAVSAGAQWQLNNGGIWLGSGMTVSGLSPGAHTVSFKSISGWNTPPVQVVNVVAGGANSVIGTYVSNVTTPTVNVTSPSTFRSYSPGSTCNITANISGSITSKKIEYTVDGVNWNYIWGISTTNTSLSHNWQLPVVFEPTWFVVRVTVDYLGGSISDISDVYGVIIPQSSSFSLNNGISHIYWPFETGLFDSFRYYDGQIWLGRNTSGYGEKAHQCSDYYSRDYNKFGGIICYKDFFAPFSGTVLYAEGSFTDDCDDQIDPGGYGNQIVIQSVQNPEFAFRVAHLNAVSVQAGDNVFQGQKIGEIGSTGNSDGPHAHCTLYRNINQNRTFSDQGGVTITTSLYNRLVQGKSGVSHHSSHCTGASISIYAAEFKFDAATSGGGGLSNEFEPTDQISIYPNPTSGILNFNIDVQEVVVFNALGAVLISERTTGQRKRMLDISHLEKGIYFVGLTLDNGTKFQYQILKE